MARKRKIPAATRRQQDLLTRNGEKVADVYAKRLGNAREKELRRVLAQARDLTNPEAIAPLLEAELSEGAYLGKWWTDLWDGVGTPAASATAAALGATTAAGDAALWSHTLRAYATRRAGANISLVTGTWKRSLTGALRGILAEATGEIVLPPGVKPVTYSVEAITRELFRRYRGDIEVWQCRRIAQTEAMIGMAEAGANAAQTLEIPFTKQWCTSGLDNVRLTHQEVDGVIVDENEPFELPGGWLMYPHDTSLGADASEIINCACACIRRPK